ncbi:hypothetical protein HDU96_008096 [Phlyctochytrium bullatum]|nr:hypothetical protein HDU96_008096 [Phlyctochytrium bullatum]
MQDLPPNVVPALRVPTLGQPTFPNELLRLILFDVSPNDLISLAAANRHLRSAVAASINQELADRHISRTVSYDEEANEENDLLENVRSPKKVTQYEALREKRVRAFSAAIHRRFELSQSTCAGSEAQEIEDYEIYDATEMAATLKSMDIFQCLRNTFPKPIFNDPETQCMRMFLHESASKGFCEGLALIPANHRIFSTVAGTSILEEAISSNHPPAVKLLLKKGAIVRNIHGETYVHSNLRLLSGDANCEILRLLLKHGLDASAFFLKTLESFNGITPHGLHETLTLFLESEQITCIRLLLEAGAGVNAVNNDGATALSLSCTAGNEEAVQILIDAGATLDTKSLRPPLHAAGYHHAPDCVKLLLRAGAEVNLVDANGKTALHIAMKRQDLNVATMLLEAGADPTIRCNAALAPLQEFPFDSDWTGDMGQLLDRLLEKGVDLDAVEGLRKKLFSAAFRDRGLQRWLLVRGGVGGNMVDSFLDWMFSKM